MNDLAPPPIPPASSVEQSVESLDGLSGLEILGKIFAECEK